MRCVLGSHEHCLLFQMLDVSACTTCCNIYMPSCNSYSPSCNTCVLSRYTCLVEFKKSVILACEPLLIR